MELNVKDERRLPFSGVSGVVQTGREKEWLLYVLESFTCKSLAQVVHI